METDRAVLERLVLARVLSEAEFDGLLASLSRQSVPFFVDTDPIGVRFLMGEMDEAALLGRLARRTCFSALLWAALLFLLVFGSAVLMGPGYFIEPEFLGVLGAGSFTLAFFLGVGVWFLGVRPRAVWWIRLRARFEELDAGS